MRSTVHNCLSLSVCLSVCLSLSLSLSLSLRFNGHFPVGPGLAGVYWRIDGGDGDNWTTRAISRAKLQSNHHHQQTNIQFLQAGCPSCHPTNSVKALKGKYHISWTWLPRAHLGSSDLSLTTNSSWLPWGRVAMPLISPLMPVTQHRLYHTTKPAKIKKKVIFLCNTSPECQCNAE